MDRDSLKVNHRGVTGKKVRFLRREGVTPVNLYGPNIESTPLQVETDELRHLLAKAGRNALISLKVEGDKKPKMVMVRDIQRHPLNDSLLHVDFFQVEMTHKVRADVPIHFVGEAPASKSRRAMLIESLTELHVEALPADLPRYFEVDMSVLEEIDQAIHVGDLSLPEGVEVLTDPEHVIVKVMEAKVEVVEEVVAEEEEEAEEVEEAAEEGEEKAAEKEEKEE